MPARRRWTRAGMRWPAPPNGLAPSRASRATRWVSSRRSDASTRAARSHQRHPGQLLTSLDVRHRRGRARAQRPSRRLLDSAQVDRRRGVGSTSRWDTRLDQPSTAMDPASWRRSNGLSAGSGASVHRMPSGAGHDAMIMAARMPAAMLFVRSPGGISHHPDETVLEDDVAAALAAGQHFSTTLARSARCDRPRRARRHGRHARAASAGRTWHRGRTHSSRCRRTSRGGRRGDRRARTATSCQASSTCTCTSTSPAAPTGRAPPPAAARWPPAAARSSSTCRSTRRRAPSTRGSSTANAPRSRRRRSPISDCGADSSRARSPTWPRWPPAASSASRRSCAHSGLPEFPRADDVDAVRRACGRPRGSACRSPCTPRARN